jgi:hypothetical protein
MTLTRLLEINRSLIEPQDERSLYLTEGLWIEAGSPTERVELLGFLETALQRLVKEGVGYPPVLLKRKKQLDRREWKPRDITQSPDKSAPHVGSGCLKCGGLGYWTRKDGRSGSLCECGAWKQGPQSNRKTRS